MHSQGLLGRMQDGVEAYHFVYLANIEVHGACDRAPHAKSINTLPASQLDIFLTRRVCSWLRTRRLRPTLLSSGDEYLEARCPGPPAKRGSLRAFTVTTLGSLRCHTEAVPVCVHINLRGQRCIFFNASRCRRATANG